MATVKYDKNGGSIYVRIQSGPPCIGTFGLWLFNQQIGNIVQLYPGSLNLIHDQIPDNLVLPLDFEIIQHVTLRIVGRYGPLPGHSQVAVRYIFHQNGQVLDITPNNYNIIQENVTTPPPFKQYKHDFEFEPFN